ncbi:MAG: ISAs1 family transposase [Saprospirales bacterium]|nr:ISAs1 family transposase [Saprospirales bacterium]
MQSVSPEELATKFARWMEQYFPVEQEQWLALDGKALGSTVQNPHGSLQSFVYVVSVFAQRSGLVHQMVHFESGKAYEAEAVRQLVEKLGLKGAIFTLDALHSQKNANAHSRTGLSFFDSGQRHCNKLFAQIQLFTALCHPFSVCETIEKDWQAGAPKGQLFFNQVDLPQG